MAKICCNSRLIRNRQTPFQMYHLLLPLQNQMTTPRRFWSPQEDQTLTTIVQDMQPINWTLVALKFFNQHPSSNRNSKQCRERWIHKLSISEVSQPWTDKQEKLMVDLFVFHSLNKNKWKAISEGLSLESGNERHPTEVKNRFYALVRRGLRRINNFIGKEIEPQQIRTLKPSTISSVMQKQDPQDSKQFIQIIYEMAMAPVGQENLQCQKETLSALLKVITETNSEDKENKKLGEGNKMLEEGNKLLENNKMLEKNKIIEGKSVRKYSGETASSEFSVPKRDLYSSITTMGSREDVAYMEQDIGCFLNIDSPVLQFEEFIFP